MRIYTIGDNVEIIGQAMLSIFHNLSEDEIRPYLERHNLQDVEPDVWYPAQLWLDCMTDLAQDINFTQNAVAIGLKIAENVVLPPQLANASLTQVLTMWGKIYENQHRGGDIGYIITDKLNETHYKTTHKRPYPDDVMYGVAYGFAKRFLPAGTHFKVYYDDKTTRMDKGGRDTVIHVEWS